MGASFFFHYLKIISEVLLEGSESDFESSLFELGDFLELVWFKIVVTLNSHANRKPKFWNNIFGIFNKSEKNSNFYNKISCEKIIVEFRTNSNRKSFQIQTDSRDKRPIPNLKLHISTPTILKKRAWAVRKTLMGQTVVFSHFSEIV